MVLCISRQKSRMVRAVLGEKTLEVFPKAAFKAVPYPAQLCTAACSLPIVPFFTYKVSCTWICRAGGKLKRGQRWERGKQGFSCPGLSRACHRNKWEISHSTVHRQLSLFFKRKEMILNMLHSAWGFLKSGLWQAKTLQSALFISSQLLQFPSSREPFQSLCPSFINPLFLISFLKHSVSVCCSVSVSAWASVYAALWLWKSLLSDFLSVFLSRTFFQCLLFNDCVHFSFCHSRSLSQPHPQSIFDPVENKTNLISHVNVSNNLLNTKTNFAFKNQ